MNESSCSISMCERPRYARSWCKLHYERWRKHGDPNTLLPPTPPPVVVPRSPHERFWEKVEKTEGCWLWTAGKLRSGYGSFGVTKSRITVAHRLAYEWLVGPIPEGLQLDHLCRNRACVNPAHLEPVTAEENKRRGTSRAAENARKTHCKYGHKFTPENTIWVKAPSRPRGGRHCRACARRKDAERRARRRAA